MIINVFAEVVVSRHKKMRETFASLLCEFQCVGLQINQDLLDSLFFGADNMVLVLNRYGIIRAILLSHGVFHREIDKILF